VGKTHFVTPTCEPARSGGRRYGLPLQASRVVNFANFARIAVVFFDPFGSLEGFFVWEHAENHEKHKRDERGAWCDRRAGLGRQGNCQRAVLAGSPRGWRRGLHGNVYISIPIQRRKSSPESATGTDFSGGCVCRGFCVVLGFAPYWRLLQNELDAA
jgi:hypothetical protein